ncbi:hypothetical protein [Dubosiella newyorkensis]|uniref:hypothetical protein n=1 Tax=Dubosiella newyorkensis TaxID=1862672 RepID=UPI002584B011|nr:hypothetical protein [Dubosiella newyorkensis]
MIKLTSRIAILDQNDTVVAFLDNNVPDGLPFWDDELHEYLKGTSNTFTFKSDARHPDSLYLVEGYKIAFKTDRRDYYLNIMIVHRDENEVEVEAWSTNLELLNEQCDAFDCQENWSFTQYKNKFDPENTVQIGLNEVSDKQIKNKWDGENTVLSRLYSLANVFDAELEFVPVLNSDYSLNKIVMNVYRAHSDTVQGIGKADVANLTYGREIKGIKKTSDITDLYTCIYPHGGTIEGSDAKVDISGVSHAVKDKDGRVEYFTDGALIRAPLARDRFPSFMSKSQDRYVLVHWDCDVTDKEMLYGRALAELKKNCTPKVTYEIDGYADTGIGDTVRITDEEYNPILYLEARVTEQVRSITDESRNKTIYSNIEVLKSEIDTSLVARVEALIKENKVYIGQIMSDNGIQFVNDTGSTTLTAQVMDGVVDIVSQYQIVWKKDGTQIATTKNITVSSGDFDAQAVYGFEATKDGKVYARAEVTLTNVHDGATPEPLYLHIRYSNDGGQTFTGNNGKTEGKWMGTYSDHLEADSELVSDYTWVKIRGDDGQSLVSMTREFYMSTSNTAQEGGSWSATPPTFDATKYLWVRLKAVYKNPDAIAYSDPELDGTWSATLQAIETANQAATSASNASQSAQNAVQQAGEAVNKAQEIEQEIGPIKTGIQEAKDAAAEAKQDVADATEQILLDISGSYATKSELSDVEGDLQTQITANADGLASKVSNTEYQQNKADIDAELLKQSNALTAAQNNLSTLQSAQSEANQKLTKAEADLKAAQDAVSALESDQTTTTEQLNAAKSALATAQQAVDKATADVTQAKKDIAAAQGQISDIQDGIDGLTSRVSTAETNISQNSQAISLRATKTEVNTAIKGAKDYADSQIDIKAGQITQTVTQVSSKVDALTSQKQETYYYQSTSNTTQSGGSWSTTKPSEASGKYIWMKIKFTFVDGTTSETSPICMTGATGAPGSPGATGKGVKSTAITYQSGTSGTTAPTGSWNATVPAVSQGQYLWTRTILTYTDNTTSTSYSVSYIPKNGTNGTNGTSVTVSSTSVTYQKSSSGTTAPTGTWVNSPPATNAGEYLWTKTVVNYSDGKSTTAYSVSRNGSNGTNGTNGTSVTVKSTAITYQAGASGTTVPTGTWLTTIPTVPVGQFLWTRTIVTYSDNKTTTSYSVSRQGTDGTDAFLIVYDTPNGLEFTASQKTLTITAKVFKGGKELTDTQVNAFGAIKWYQVGVAAAIATGKTLTLTAPKEVYATLEN